MTRARSSRRFVGRGCAVCAFLAVCACGDVHGDPVTGRSGAGGTGGAPPVAPCTAGAGCIGCESNDDCGASDRNLCHPEGKQCVECVTDAHCEDTSERCSRELGECAVPCTQVGDCPSDEFCDTILGACVDCLSDADCASDPERPFCRGSECRSAIL